MCGKCNPPVEQGDITPRKLIALLPTGEWTELDSPNDIEFLYLTQKHLEKMQLLSDSSLRELASGLTREGINAVFAQY